MSEVSNRLIHSQLYVPNVGMRYSNRSVFNPDDMIVYRHNVTSLIECFDALVMSCARVKFVEFIEFDRQSLEDIRSVLND
jgi:hypothetical protein